MLKKVFTRLQNKKIAFAVGSGILLILVNLGVIDTGLAAQWENTLDIALGVLVAVGVMANPESHIKE
jgi:uncharacterized membrane protein